MTLVDEVRNAERHIAMFASLRDAEFVRFVRIAERKFPGFRSLRVWHEDVRRELDMRLLLKGD